MKIKKQPMLKKTFNMRSNLTFNMYHELYLNYCTVLRQTLFGNLKEKERCLGYNLVVKINTT